MGARNGTFNVVDETKADYKFLYYYFYSDTWRATVNENIVLGATVDRIPLIKFPDFPVELPPLETQHRIADILSAYDDLIENNQKANQVAGRSSPAAL